jgi:hypothetical protein
MKRLDEHPAQRPDLDEAAAYITATRSAVSAITPMSW